MMPSKAHKVYIECLRRMTPEERLKKAFEMKEFAVQLFTQGLRKVNPNLTEEEFQQLLRERLDKCHNRNW